MTTTTTLRKVGNNWIRFDAEGNAVAAYGTAITDDGDVRLVPVRFIPELPDPELVDPFELVAGNR